MADKSTTAPLTLRVFGDFNYPDSNNDRFAGKSYENGNYTLDSDQIKGALKFADEYFERTKQKSYDPKTMASTAVAASVDGNKDNLRREELAAYLLALSMGKPEIEGSRVASTFDNKLSREDYEFAEANPQAVLEVAKQIYKDNAEKFGVSVTGNAGFSTDEAFRQTLPGLIRERSPTRCPSGTRCGE